MTVNKYSQILNRLVERTERGDIDWKETANPSAFQASLPNYSLIISEENVRGQDMPDYVISIINSEGKIVDKFSDVTLHNEDTNVKYFELMRDMFNSVRRKALGVDEALDDILNQLENNPNRF